MRRHSQFENPSAGIDGMSGGSNDDNSHRPDGMHPESDPMHLSDVNADREPTSVPTPGQLETRQPAGLWVLFITEMWERFSYYGMRALLVLYLMASTDELIQTESGETVANSNPGFGWSEENAVYLYGLYTSAVYLTPII